MESLIFNEMGVRMTLPVFTQLILSVGSQMKHWLTGLFEGLTILIETLFQYGSSDS